MLKFVELEVRNFLSYSHCVFKFEEGVFLVLGRSKDSLNTSNGSGKSSLFVDAILFAIYGVYDRDVKSIFSNKQDETYVRISFVVGDDYYNLIRYKYPKSKVILYKNDTEISFHTISDYNKYILDVIKIPYEVFSSSIVIKQGSEVSLLNMTPTNRKNYFFSVIGNELESVVELLNNEIKNLSDKLKEKKDIKNKLDKEMSFLKGKLEAISNSEDADVSALKEEYKKYLNELEELNKKIKSEEEILNSLIQERERKLLEYNSYINSLKIKYNNYNKLKSGVCPLCKSKVDVKGIDEKLRKIESELKKEFVFDKENEKNLKKNEINLLTNQKNVLLGNIKSVSDRIRKCSNQSDSLNELNNQIEKLINDIDKIDEELINLELEYNLHVDLKKMLQPSGVITGIILESYIDFYNHIFSNIVKNFFPSLKKEVKLEITDKGLNLSGIDYKSMSGGEKKRLDVASKLAFNEFLLLLKDANVSLRVYDEIFNYLDGNVLAIIIDYIKNMFSGFGYSVYVMTHDAGLKNEFDKIIMIEKKNGISKIVEE